LTNSFIHCLFITMSIEEMIKGMIK
jgi:hypothetical protein